jgi:hypothetical protein
MQILEGNMWQQQLIQTCESGRYHLSQEHGELINVHDWYQSFTAICCPPKASSDKQMSKRKDRRKGKRGRVEAESPTVLVDSTTLQYPLCWTTALFLPLCVRNGSRFPFFLHGIWAMMMMMIFNMLSQSKVHKGNHGAPAGWPAPHAKERVPRFCPAGGTGLNLSSAEFENYLQLLCSTLWTGVLVSDFW